MPRRRISAGRGHPLLHMGLEPYATASLARIWKVSGPAMRAPGVCFPCTYLQVELVEGFCISDVCCYPGRCRHALLFDVCHILQAPSSFSPSPSHHTLWSGKGGIEKPVIMLADCGDKMLHRHYDHGSPTLIPNNSKFQGCAIRWHGSARKDVGTCFIGHAVHLMSCSPVYHTSLPGF